MCDLCQCVACAVMQVLVWVGERIGGAQQATDKGGARKAAAMTKM